jgi:hypothetical protein
VIAGSEERDMKFKVYSVQEILATKLIPSGLSITKNQYESLGRQLTIINALRFIICALVFSSPFTALFAYVLSGIFIRGIYQDYENYLYGYSYMLGLNPQILKGLKKAAEELKE